MDINNAGHVIAISVPIAIIPEPESYAMFLAGLGLIGFMARRERLLACCRAPRFQARQSFGAFPNIVAAETVAAETQAQGIGVAGLTEESGGWRR